MKFLPSLILLTALCARAANHTDTFEYLPNTTPVWQTAPPAPPLVSGFAGYTFTGGTLEVSTAASVSGDQSLQFTATAAGGTLTFANDSLGGGYQVF